MNDEEQIITGQGEQQNVPEGLDTSIANDLLGEVQRNVKVGPSIGRYGTGAGAVPIKPKISKAEQKRIANEEFVGGASGRIKSMINSPGFIGDNGMYDTNQIENRRNIAWRPEMVSLNPGVAYTQNFTSDTGTIIKDSIIQFGMSLGTLGDKAMIGLGGITSKITGQEFGVEIRDRAYDALNAATYNIGLQSSEPADVETWASKITMGAASMVEFMALGAMTGGIAPLAQMGVDVFGSGTYNNMIKYANEHGGSIEGYEGNWIDIFADLTNATAQVVIERYLGVGSSRFLRGTGGHFFKEAFNGFIQEGSQEFLGDVAEIFKGNEELGILADQWQDYLVSGIIGGVLQGALGAATYKGARLQADNDATQLYIRTKKAFDKDWDETDPKNLQEARAFARELNDNVEKGLAKDVFEEIINRVDANNDRGRIRDKLVSELVKAKKASLGLSEKDELSAEDLADIQNAATIITRESVREAWATGKLMTETQMANVYADGAKLKIRPTVKGAIAQEIKTDQAEGLTATAEQAEVAETTTNAEIAEAETKVNNLLNRKADRSKEARKKAIRQEGIKTQTERGAYDSRAQEIILNKDADISTILHEFAHMWMDNYFKAARSEHAPKEFKEWWGRVEKELGIRPGDKFLDRDISEKFARAFEKYIMDGGKGASGFLKLAYDNLSKRLADVYDGLATQYFDDVKQLNPEVQGWFAQNEKVASVLAGEEPDKRKKEREQARKEVAREDKTAKSVRGAVEAVGDYLDETNPYQTDEKFETALSKRASREFGTETETMNRENQKQMQIDAEKIVKTDAGTEYALSVLSGNIRDPYIRSGAFYTALMNKVSDNADYDLLRKIQATGYSETAVEAGREVAALKNYTRPNGSIDSFKAVETIENLYKKLSPKEQAEYNKGIEQLKSFVAKHDEMFNNEIGKKLQSLLECRL